MEKSQLRKRIESFLWRLGMVVLVAGIDFTAANLGAFDLSAPIVGVLGLVLGEVSKWLNSQKDAPSFFAPR